MNKTININLANLFFHIDEEAYTKLKHYLEAVKRSFANTSGSDEIIADIEARIAELFLEKMENVRQVITLKEVDEVIAIMGQPEDYMVDEDMFDDRPSPTPKPGKVKKLYRDIDNKYFGGVSSGLAHYFGLKTLWVRLLWIALTIFSWGGFVFIYLLLWLLIPEAVTTAQKLAMGGETINISNIEKKVKEGFEDVAEKVKNVDYEKVGNRVKHKGKSFLNTITDIIAFFFKIIGKFIGIILIITGATGIVALVVALFTAGILDTVRIPGIDMFYLVNSTSIPMWFASLLVFFVLGIPFFFIMYLGIKILANNLKSLGKIAKFTLLGLWIISFILLIFFGTQLAAAFSYKGNVTYKETLALEQPQQPLNINFKSSGTDKWDSNIGINGVILDYTAQGNEILISDNVRLALKTSSDTSIQIEVRKGARGNSFRNATEISDKINYSYSLEGNILYLDDFLTTAKENKYRDQEVMVYLFLPMDTEIRYNNYPKKCWQWYLDNDRNIGSCDIANMEWKMGNNGVMICQNCPEAPAKPEAEIAPEALSTSPEEVGSESGDAHTEALENQARPPVESALDTVQ